MKINNINLGEYSYKIYTGQNVLSEVGNLIKTVFNTCKIAVVTDETVNELYGEAVKTSLENAGFKAQIFALKSGEETKSIDSMAYLLSKFAQMQLSRNDLVVGLGGGVIGDLSGFVASCYMRGLSHIQIPTTLLAQVDSSVGGKTAVNLKEGKNLVGAFWQPSMVVIDTEVLNTLDDRQFASGMAEVIKYGAIFSGEFFNYLDSFKDRKEIMKEMPEIIYKCCDYKRQVVEIDERDTGDRMLLNFGHTFGHIIEMLGKYHTYTHGEAVAIGMYIASIYGETANITPKGTNKKIADLCSKYSLPVYDKINLNSFVAHIGVDKKVVFNKVNLILLNKLGNAGIYPVTKNEFQQNIDLMVNAYE